MFALYRIKKWIQKGRGQLFAAPLLHLFAVPTQAAGHSCGTNIAVHKGKALVQRLIVADAGELLDLAQRQQLAAIGESQDLLQIVAVVDVFHVITPFVNRETAIHSRVWRSIISSSTSSNRIR